MKLIDRLVKCQGRADVIEIVPFGDCHIGSRNCAETPLRQIIKSLPENALVILGGDIIDAIRPQDIKRFDFDTLPDWMIGGDADTTRDMLGDIVNQQIKRAVDIFSPIKDRIVGAIEGNHERDVLKYAGFAAHKAICKGLGIQDLTDQALIRFRFQRLKAVKTFIIYIRHGYGGGRTAGAEPQKLDRMLNEWEQASVCFTGNTHCFHILPPKPVLEMPRSGAIPKELTCRYRWAGNWGCWLYSHAEGASSYASRACYPARPMLTCRAVLRPFTVVQKDSQQLSKPEIELRSITIS